jgi:glycosyltransferase involved in cell wall biosynthesis
VRLAVVSEPPRVSSCLSLILSQALGLKDIGHDVSVIMQERNANRIRPFYKELTKVNVQLLGSVPLLSKLAARPWSHYVGQIGSTYDWIKAIDIASILSHGATSNLWIPPLRLDAMICHTTYSPLSVLSWYGTGRTKRVLYLHDWPFYYFARGNGLVRSKVAAFAKIYESLVLAKSDQIVCLTRGVSRVWKEMFNVQAGTVYPGCYPSPEFHKLRKRFILCVWRWQEDTRPFFLLPLMKRLRNTSLGLIVVGSWKDNALRLRFETEVAREGLSERISILSNIPLTRLVELYRTASCLLYPAVNQFGYAGLEAASQGAPLVAPRGSGLWEMFSTGQEGYEVIEGDLDSYVEAVEQFEDPDRAKEMGYNIWRRSHDYDWASHSRKMEKVITG